MLPWLMDRSDCFDDLTGYEKGVVARALIRGLVKQGNLETEPDRQTPGRISISIEDWQLKLLARFNDDAAGMEDEKQILLDRLCKLR